jgi:SAM-dependent methyltransferase
LAFDYQAVAGDYQFRALESRRAMQRFWHAGKLTLIDRLVTPHLDAASRLLEIGCGSGNLLLRATARGSYAVALDLSMGSLAFVRSRLQDARGSLDGPRGFGCVQAIGEQLPLADDSFDCVLLSEVVEHLDAPHVSVQEACRVLRRGGRLLLTTPNYRSFWPVMEWIVDRLALAPQMSGEQHISRFSPQSLRRLLVASGLRIEYFGTMYALSPFLALASSAWANRRLRSELGGHSLRGMILVAVAVKS